MGCTGTFRQKPSAAGIVESGMHRDLRAYAIGGWHCRDGWTGDLQADAIGGSVLSTVKCTGTFRLAPSVAGIVESGCTGTFRLSPSVADVVQRRCSVRDSGGNPLCRLGVELDGGVGRPEGEIFILYRVSRVWREVDVRPLLESAGAGCHSEEWHFGGFLHIRVVVGHGKVLPLVLWLLLLEGVAPESGAQSDVHALFSSPPELGEHYGGMPPWRTVLHRIMIKNNR